MDPSPPSLFFTRYRDPALIKLLPKFPNSQAPILFHLPLRTVERVLEDIPPHLIAPAFIENGKSSFGLKQEVISRQLNRWRRVSKREVAVTLSMNLSRLIIARAHTVSVELLPGIIEVTGLLTEQKLMPGEISNLILKSVLPRCLDHKQLSRADLASLLSGVRRVPVSTENAVMFPMISNFAQWYLARHRANRVERSRRQSQRKRAANLLPHSSNTVKQIFS